MKGVHMKSPLSITVIGSITALAWLVTPTASQAVVTQCYDVPATANIYSAGLATPVDPGGYGAGTLPICIGVAPGESAFEFLASGSVTENTLYNVYHGPDGGSICGSTVYAYGGLSGFLTDLCVPLAGVFLSDSAPSDPAPPTLDFRAQGMGLDFTVLSPLIGQVFFIGDGQTTGGMVQTFYVPAGATRLFLGCPDSPYGEGFPGAYDDNAGTFSVAVTPVPEPAVGITGMSLLALSALRLRRRVR
jgi:hypothetical protein